MNIDLVLLVVLTLAALWTVLAGTLMRSVIGLAGASIVLTILMVRLGSPLAAMFELSVCAGLITAIFISAISLVKPLTFEDALAQQKGRLKRYIMLPVILVAAGLALFALNVRPDALARLAAPSTDVRSVLWNDRQLDLIGQIAVLFAGIFAVLILFRYRVKK